jgi:hypothetical protein
MRSFFFARAPATSVFVSGWPQMSKKLLSVKVRKFGDSMWMMPSDVCVWIQ